jgi:dTDP-4-dehydrorhamnose 3,5-epimerase
MRFIPTAISGCYEIEPKFIQDSRGEFARIFCQQEFKELRIDFQVAQSNYSRTYKKGSLRGLHYQTAPHAEGKLVRVERGSIFDVCVDLRKDSPSFGRWHGTSLSAQNRKMLLLPKGCAHGFQTLEDDCEMVYLHSDFYAPECDRTAHHQDPLLNIQWPLPVAMISEKDHGAQFFETNFKGIIL